VAWLGAWRGPAPLRPIALTIRCDHGRGRRGNCQSRCTAQSEIWVDDFRDRLRGLVAQLRAKGASSDQLAAELGAMAKAAKES
jgi:hypothetical protein